MQEAKENLNNFAYLLMNITMKSKFPKIVAFSVFQCRTQVICETKLLGKLIYLFDN